MSFMLFNLSFTRASMIFTDTLTISTSRFCYGLGATINVYGNLTRKLVGTSGEGNPVKDGLVAIQVEDSFGNSELIRVVSTGANPSSSNPSYSKVKIIEFLSINSQGNPQNTFNKGSRVLLKITITSLEKINATIALNLFDSVGVSVGVCEAPLVPLEPGVNFTWVRDVSDLLIANDAYAGPTTCTVNVLTNRPKYGGYPYCQESSIKFTIVDESKTPGSGAVLNNPSPDGSFNISFKLPNTATIGSHNVYVSARYNAWANASFDYAWLLTDIDRNYKVNIQDLFIVAKAFGSQPGDANWNVKADVDGNNQVNIVDVYKVARDFGKKRV
jgi:hypothetical protein